MEKIEIVPSHSCVIYRGNSKAKQTTETLYQLKWEQKHETRENVANECERGAEIIIISEQHDHRYCVDYTAYSFVRSHNIFGECYHYNISDVGRGIEIDTHADVLGRSSSRCHWTCVSAWLLRVYQHVKHTTSSTIMQ